MKRSKRLCSEKDGRDYRLVGLEFDCREKSHDGLGIPRYTIEQIRQAEEAISKAGRKMFKDGSK